MAFRDAKLVVDKAVVSVEDDVIASWTFVDKDADDGLVVKDTAVVKLGRAVSLEGSVRSVGARLTSVDAAETFDVTLDRLALEAAATDKPTRVDVKVKSDGTASEFKVNSLALDANTLFHVDDSAKPITGDEPVVITIFRRRTGVTASLADSVPAGKPKVELTSGAEVESKWDWAVSDESIGISLQTRYTTLPSKLITQQRYVW